MTRYLRLGIFSAAVTAAALSAAACGSSVETSNGGNAGSSTTTTTTTDTTGTTTGSTTGSTTGTTTSTTPLETCGGKLGGPCSSDRWCDYPNDQCGSTDMAGACKPSPEGCPEFEQPTCGCDGKVYGNACEANAAGVDVSALGGCEAPAGMFPCGPFFCALGLDYCRGGTTEVGGGVKQFDCLPLPPLCEAPASCSCLKNLDCGETCQQTAEGGLVIDCPGG